MNEHSNKDQKGIKWSVGTKIGAGFGLALTILAVLGLVTYRTTGDLEDATKVASHSKEVLKTLEDLSGDAITIESAERGYVLTGQEAYLDPYRVAAEDVNHKMKELRRLSSDNATQQRQIDNLESLIGQRVASAKQNIE